MLHRKYNHCSNDYILCDWIADCLYQLFYLAYDVRPKMKNVRPTTSESILIPTIVMGVSLNFGAMLYYNKLFYEISIYFTSNNHFKVNSYLSWSGTKFNLGLMFIDKSS